jgi:hypothetical protein
MGSLLYSSQTHLRRHADLAGMTASGVCLVHCLLTPFLISLAPDLLPYLPGDLWFHRTLAVGIVLLGAIAFFPGYLIHRRRSLLVPVSVGVALILLVAYFGETISKPVELILNVSGSLLLVAAHLLNRSFCRQCHSCSDSRECHTTQIS